MAIDRKNRDLLSVMLVSFLRGECSQNDLRSRVRALYEENKGTDNRDLYLAFLVCNVLDSSLYGGEDSNEKIPVELAEKMTDIRRNTHLRYLAFLRSDLELESYKPPSQVTRKDTDYEFFAARWHTAALAIGLVLLGITGWFSWWTYWICGALSFAWFLWSQQRHDAVLNKNRDDMSSFPFANEREWRLHEARLEQFKLSKPCVETEDRTLPKSRFLPAAGKYLKYLLMPFLWPFSMTALCVVGFVLQVSKK
jgi:hypothetical protein